MKTISTLLAAITLVTILPNNLFAQAQTTVFEALFDQGFPPNTTILDEDAQQANSLLEDYGFGTKSPWRTTQTVIKDGQNRISGGVAIAASYFEAADATAADDYLIFSDVALPSQANTCVLSWEALSLDPSFSESYEVYVLEGNVTSKEEILKAPPAARIANETGVMIDPSTHLFNNWQAHSLDLTAFAGKRISIVFRLITPSGFMLLLDNVRVVAAEQKPLAAPVAETIKISGLDNGGATIRWAKVPEATSYLVSIFARELYAQERTYLFDKKETEKLGVSISSLPQDKQYFVCIAAKRGSEVSAESQEVPIVASLDRETMPIPEGLELIYTTDKIYTVGWKAVPIASAYESYAYAHEIAQTDQVYELREGFDAVPEGTLDAPIELLYNGLRIDDYCQIKGWGGNVLALAQGGVVIKNRFKGFSWSYFDCPTMTLGNDRSGVFTVDVTAVSQVGDSVELKLYEHIAGRDSVALRETVRLMMSQERETLHFAFTQGKPNSFISIEVHTFNTQNALIDEVVIRRPMKKDEEMKLLRSVVQTQHIRSVFPEQIIGVEHGYYSFSVSSRAIYRKPILSLASAEVYSQGKPGRISPMGAQLPAYRWRLTPGGIIVDLFSPEQIGLYDMSGAQLFLRHNEQGTVLIPLLGEQRIYLLRVGKEATLIALP